MVKRKKRDRALASRWIAAAVLTVLIGLLLALCLGPQDTPEPEAPAPIPGIDVSSHQGDIDWDQVASSGVRFAIIRLGYRSYRDGMIHIDERAQENLTEARAAGLEIGAYFFSQALTVAEAKEEAAMALEILDGMELDLPLAYDWEYVSPEVRTGDMEPETLTACVHTFCEEVGSAGYEPMVYFNQELSRTLLDLDTIRQYPFWYARYADEMDLDRPVLFWQHSDEGSIPGIEEAVDLDWWYPSTISLDAPNGISASDGPPPHPQAE